MRIDAALAVFLVMSQVRRVAPKVQGTRRSARCDALASDEDFSEEEIDMDGFEVSEG
jgi:hypothetical protein